MKTTAALFFIAIAPSLATAQPLNIDSKLCPLSHWSTTGAACDYAPDLSPRIETDLTNGINPWATNDTLTGLPDDYKSLPFPGWVPPLGAWRPDSAHFREMMKDMPDSLFNLIFKPSKVDRLDWRNYKPLLHSPDPASQPKIWKPENK